MGIEEDIRDKLHQGITPKNLIEQGYKKSTVYKVYETQRQFTNQVNPPMWTIEAISFSNGARYLPGNSAQVSFYFKNNADRDLYVMNLGIQPEWLGRQTQWIAQPIRELLRPGQTKFVSFSFVIPSDLPLGEYEFYFGVEGQYLPAQSYENTRLTTQWSEPKIIEVKQPTRGINIFLSHSIHDKYLVSELEKQLDENGIKVSIGEDIVRPGENLENKFKELINSCTIFVALLTESAINSPWVNQEIQYAINMNKPRILLKEKKITFNSNYEWTEFSLSAPPHVTLQIIMNAINNIREASGVNSAVAALLGVAFIGLLASALSNK